MYSEERVDGTVRERADQWTNAMEELSSRNFSNPPWIDISKFPFNIDFAPNSAKVIKLSLD